MLCRLSGKPGMLMMAAQLWTWRESALDV